MTTKINRPPIPHALVDVALMDGPSSAVSGGEGLSSFLEGVRRTERGELGEGEVAYPLPVIRRPRFTRWRMADVRAWLIARASQQCTETAAAMITKATKASAEARRPEAVAKAKATRQARIAARDGAGT